MLTEEANEFFIAQTLVDRLDAWADFAFVAIGTACKYMAVRHKDFRRAYDFKSDFDCLAEYINDVQNQMLAMLSEELEIIKTSIDVDQLLGDVLLLVVEANELKGFELNADGKVIKPLDFIKPEYKINNLLIRTLGDKYVSYES